jgi:hypothetical protein
MAHRSFPHKQYSSENKMYGGPKNVAGNAEQVRFSANRELQLVSSAGSATKKRAGQLGPLWDLHLTLPFFAICSDIDLSSHFCS